MGLLYTTIVSGAAVSGNVDLTQEHRLVAIAVPGITSADLLIHGSFNTTSADFQRLLETRSPGSGDLRFATGPGSRMVLAPLIYNPNYVRLETAVAQIDTRTFTLLTQRW